MVGEFKTNVVHVYEVKFCRRERKLVTFVLCARHLNVVVGNRTIVKARRGQKGC